MQIVFLDLRLHPSSVPQFRYIQSLKVIEARITVPCNFAFLGAPLAADKVTSAADSEAVLVGGQYAS